MNSEARMKWDAEKAFAQIEGAEHFHKKTGDRPFLVLEDARAMRQPYTPPSNITPERLAQLKRYEPVKHKGRDYEALTKAALKKPVGYWEDAPRGQAFTGVGNGSCPKTDATASKQGVAPLAPTPSTEELYEPVGTMPIVGDTLRHPQDTSQMRPKVTRIEPRIDGMRWSAMTDTYGVCGLMENGGGWRILKRKPATIEGRVWKNRAPRNIGETCYEHWRAVLVGGKMFTRGAWNKPGVWSGKARDVHAVFELEADGYPEIFGPERDAVIAECRKALGL